jgi:hypothetical protein
MFRHACVMGFVGHRLEALRQLLQELPVPELGKVKTRLMPRACRRGNPAFGGERLCERLAVSQYPAGPHGLWLRYSEDECSRLFSMDHTIPPAIAATVTASATQRPRTREHDGRRVQCHGSALRPLGFRADAHCGCDGREPDGFEGARASLVRVLAAALMRHLRPSLPPPAATFSTPPSVGFLAFYSVVG